MRQTDQDSGDTDNYNRDNKKLDGLFRHDQSFLLQIVLRVPYEQGPKDDPAENNYSSDSDGGEKFDRHSTAPQEMTAAGRS